MKTKIIELREEIDKIDGALMSLLDKRAVIARAIGEIKLQENLPVLNRKREVEILSKTSSFDNNSFVKSIFIRILEESKKLQEEKWKSQ